MRYTLFLLTIMLLWSCQRENEKSEISDKSTTPLATPVPKEEKLSERRLVTQENFSGAYFVAHTPMDYIVQPSFGNGTDFNKYKSYFFTSPDEKAKFYIYASPLKSRPNDIIFPNEKVESSQIQHGDTLTITWKLPADRQVKYSRIFTESSTPNHTHITGFYFVDSVAYDEYLETYRQFVAGISLKP